MRCVFANMDKSPARFDQAYPETGVAAFRSASTRFGPAVREWAVGLEAGQTYHRHRDCSNAWRSMGTASASVASSEMLTIRSLSVCTRLGTNFHVEAS